MTSNLVLHKGGVAASYEDVCEVQEPERTATYTPVSHRFVIDQVRRTLPAFGLEVVKERFGLGAGGNKFFGVIDVRNGAGQPDWGIAVGLRNSYDRSIALNAVAGQRVFVCDNLAFSGDVRLRERHVRDIDNRLPDLINALLQGVISWKDRIVAQTDRFKAAEVGNLVAHDVVCEALRAGVVPERHIRTVLKEWHEPSHADFEPRTAWSLYNAFTEAAKDRSLNSVITSTIGLTGLFNRVFGDSAALPEAVEVVG
jgi:hypothetical protein